MWRFHLEMAPADGQTEPKSRIMLRRFLTEAIASMGAWMVEEMQGMDLAKPHDYERALMGRFVLEWMPTLQTDCSPKAPEQESHPRRTP